MWGEEGFSIICREFSLSLSCRWLEEDVATSEPGQKEQETNLKPPSSNSVLWGQTVTILSLTGVIEGVKKPTRKPQCPISAGILPSLLLGDLFLSFLMTQDHLSQPEQCVGSCTA